MWRGREGYRGKERIESLEIGIWHSYLGTYDDGDREGIWTKVSTYLPYSVDQSQMEVTKESPNRRTHRSCRDPEGRNGGDRQAAFFGCGEQWKNTRFAL